MTILSANEISNVASHTCSRSNPSIRCPRLRNAQILRFAWQNLLRTPYHSWQRHDAGRRSRQGVRAWFSISAGKSCGFTRIAVTRMNARQSQGLGRSAPKRESCRSSLQSACVLACWACLACTWLVVGTRPSFAPQKPVTVDPFVRLAARNWRFGVTVGPGEAPANSTVSVGGRYDGRY